MATKDQCDFFRSLYDEEERTSLQLEGRAKVYLGIISAFLVTLLLKTSDVVESAKALHIWFPLLLVEAFFLSAAMVFVILALRIRSFEAVNDGVAIIEQEFDPPGPTDPEFFEARIVDYAVASSRNRAVNNQTATMLAWGGGLIIAGMGWVLVIAVLAFIRSYKQ